LRLNLMPAVRTSPTIPCENCNAQSW
jgi:hypothetical protein